MCVETQAAIAPYEQPDYTPMATMTGTKFIDASRRAVAYLPSPKEDWKNEEDCGEEFTCTGLYNMVIRLKGTVYEGTETPDLPSNFQITSDNKESYTTSKPDEQAIDKCTEEEDWNAVMCDYDLPMGVLVFRSLDADQGERSLQPVYVSNKNGFYNRLNSYMDNCWDGFYACQVRDSIFPSLIVQDTDHYDIDYSGTPPKEQQFEFNGIDGSPGFIVTIQY